MFFCDSPETTGSINMRHMIIACVNASPLLGSMATRNRLTAANVFWKRSERPSLPMKSNIDFWVSS